MGKIESKRKELNESRIHTSNKSLLKQNSYRRMHSARINNTKSLNDVHGTAPEVKKTIDKNSGNLSGKEEKKRKKVVTKGNKSVSIVNNYIIPQESPSSVTRKIEAIERAAVRVNYLVDTFEKEIEKFAKEIEKMRVKI